MFGETTIFYIKVWNHPVETTIYKWLALGFQKGIYCEAVDIQTHMMRIGMNEPPFTSPEPKKRLAKGSKLTPANTRYDWGMAWMSTVVKKHKRENREI